MPTVHFLGTQLALGVFMNFFIRCAICATFVLVAAPIFAQQPPLTMNQAVRIAQENDPWLDGSRLREEATEAQSVAAGALPDPTISIAVANVPIDSFDFGQEPMTQLVMGVGQTFPRGDTRNLRRQQLLEISEQQPLMRLDRQAKVAVMVSQLWLESYRYSEAIRLIEQDRSLFDYLADVAESAYANALVRTSQQDVIRAQVELTRLDDRLATLRQQRDTVLAKLAEWLPDSEVASLQIATALPDLAIANRFNGAPTSSLSESEITRALLAHPSLQILDQIIQVSSTGVALAKQKYKPQWGVNASYGYRDDDPFGADRADFFSVGISFDVPLFTGNRQDKEVQSAIASQEATKTDKALALRTMRASLDSVLYALERLNQRNTLYTERLLTEVHDQAEASLNAYTNDSGDFSEVMRARIAELNTNIDFLNIRIDRLKTIAQINYFFTSAATNTNGGNAQTGVL
jgi:outer membrane protein TolC